MNKTDRMRAGVAFAVAALVLWTSLALPFLGIGGAYAGEAAFIPVNLADAATPTYYAKDEFTSTGGITLTFYKYKDMYGAELYRVHGYPAEFESTSPAAIGFYASNREAAPVPPMILLNSAEEAAKAFGPEPGTVEDKLRPNEAYVSQFSIADSKDGTPAWDAVDGDVNGSGNGNDSGPSNGIVRSFDSLQFTLHYATALQEQTTVTYFKEGDMYVKFVLPGLAREQADFDLTAMRWIEDPQVVAGSEGVVLTGKYHLKADLGKTILPGEGTLSVAVKVQGMANGAKIKPEFSAWMDGYAGGAGVGKNAPKTAPAPEFTVSASPTQVNVKLQRTLHVDYLQDWNFSSGNVNAQNKGAGVVNGRMYGYALQLQMFNANGTVKKLKGVELPQGPITFDIALKVEKTVGGTTSDITGTSGDEILPLLWDYRLFTSGTSAIGGRNMYFASNSFQPTGYAPVSTWAESQNKAYCANSGAWTITQTDATLSVTVDSYGFMQNGAYQWPLRNDNATAGTAPAYGEDMGIGVFSVGFIQVLFPVPQVVGTGTVFYLSLQDKNLKTQTLSEMTPQLKSQPKTDDDLNRTEVAVTPKGGYTKYNYLTLASYTGGSSPWSSSINLSSSNGQGADAWAPYGTDIAIYSVPATSSATDPDWQPYALDLLQKFDANAFQPYADAGENPYHVIDITPNTNAMTYKLLYVSKADGSNWASDEEMERAEMNTGATQDGITTSPHSGIPNPTLKYYASMAGLRADTADLASGLPQRLCVAVLVQGRGGIFGAGADYVGFRVHIPATAEIGEVYQTTNDVYFWRHGKGASMTHANSSRLSADSNVIANLNAPDAKIDIRSMGLSPYAKAVYENGVVKSGSHAPAGAQSGASLLIVGVEAKIIKSVEQLGSSGGTKLTYNVGAGERRVDYVLTPSALLSGRPNETGTQPVTVTITDTLPKKVTVDPATRFYMGGSYV
ncbi:MAG: hypothetical protein LBB57_05595, partial [Clostridiales Family XIII bacterium]|nr:hypothetical protein [Clostridiales Family XIII bacterium]